MNDLPLRGTKHPRLGWADPIAFFAVLAGIKLFLLISARSHIYEEHWRYGGSPSGPLARLGVCAVALAILAIAWRTTTACRETDRARPHMFSGLMVFFGLLFHISSMEVADNSYLYSLASGTINWGDVRAYLFIDCIDRAPYLAMVILPLVIGWVLLTRLKRDNLIPFLTGGMWSIYLMARFWTAPPPLRYTYALLCMALAGLAVVFAAANRAKRKDAPPISTCGRHFPILVVLVLASCQLTLFLIIWMGTEATRIPPMLTINLAVTVALGAIFWLLAARRDEWALTPFIPFLMCVYLLYGNTGYPSSKNFSQLIFNTMCLGGYWAGELVLPLALALLFLPFRKRFPVGTAVSYRAIAIIVIIFSAVDVFIYRLLGVRSTWALLFMGDDLQLVWGVVQEFITVGRALVLLGAVATYLILTALLKHVGHSAPATGRSAILLPLTLALSVCCLGAILQPGDKASRQAAWEFLNSTPLAQRLRQPRLANEDLIANGRDLGLFTESEPPVTGQKIQDWNVVLVILESMHSRYLSLFGSQDETQPLLSAYAGRMHLFPNFYSVFPNSNHARFAVLNGLYPPREYISYLNPAIPCPSLSEILHDAGWTTSMFYSSSRNYTRQWDYWQHREWDRFYDSHNMPHAKDFHKVSWGVSEEATLAAMTDELRERAGTGERFFMTYIPAAPHRPFDGASEQFKQFEEGFPKLEGNYVGRYKNELLRLDWVLASLIDELKALEILDQTLVVITNDHGEMLGEDSGPIGHGFSLAPDHCRIPLIIMRPDDPAPRIVDTLSSQVDILPTVLDALQLPLPKGELYQGISLYGPSPATRSVYLRAHEGRALIRDDLYIIDSKSGAGPGDAFKIQINGTGATYSPLDPDAREYSPAAVREDLETFERLQDSLIRYYDSYRQP